MKLFTILILLVVSIAGKAQTMRELFTNMPDTILPSLSKNDRLDMIDLIENKMTNEVTNQLRGKSKMTVLTDNLAKIQLSELAEVQLCKLPTPDSYLICMIHSVKADAWDSTTKFYNPDWTLSTYHVSTHSVGKILMTFNYYNFTDDTTLATTVSSIKNNEGKIVVKEGATVEIKWDKDQKRFVKSDNMP